MLPPEVSKGEPFRLIRSLVQIEMKPNELSLLSAAEKVF